MVRKVIAVFVCTLLLLCVAAATASASTPYHGTISSSVLDVAERMPIPFGDDYVFFRFSQYEYVLVVGDLDFNESNCLFSLNSPGLVYTLTQVNNSGYGGSYYTCAVGSTDSFSLTYDGTLLYSNLSNFPSLKSDSDLYSFCCLFLLCVFAVCIVLRSIFKFTLCLRYH